MIPKQVQERRAELEGLIGQTQAQQEISSRLLRDYQSELRAIDFVLQAFGSDELIPIPGATAPRQRRNLRELTLEYVSANPGKTVAEIAEAIGRCKDSQVQKALDHLMLVERSLTRAADGRWWVRNPSDEEAAQ